MHSEESAAAENLGAICGLIESRTGLRVGRGARQRLKGSLPQRMALGRFPQLCDYHRFLRDDPASGRELDLLAGLLTAHEPALMHPQVCEHVRRFVRMRAPADGERTTQGIAVLAIGPAAADDIYSAAVIIAEEGLDVLSAQAVLAAVDVDLDRLLAAADGYYSGRVVAAVSEESLRWLFERASRRRYRVGAALRSRVQWLYASPAEGPPRTVLNRPWDLIICRDLLGKLTSRAANAWAGIGQMLSPCGMLLADRRAGVVGDLECSRCGRFWIHVRHENWREEERAVRSISPVRPVHCCLLPRTDTLWTMIRMLREDDGNATLSRAKTVAEMDPFNAGCRLAMAVMLLRRHAVGEAQTHALAALAIDPHSPEALMVCAMVYERQNRLRKAEQFYRKALLVRPTMASAHLQLADVYRKSKRDADAQRIYDQLQDVLGNLANPTVAAGRQIHVASASSTVFRVGVNSVIRPE